MTGSMKLQPDDGPRYNLGIGSSSDNAVGSHRKFARRFAEGIGKLARNVKGDHRKEDRRTCCKITGGCQSIGDSDDMVESGSSLGTRREIAGKKTGGLASRLPEIAGVCGKSGRWPTADGG
ncbi:hypothetical protein BHM03_00006754 [Ensete ventricosum]|uniref:Uncharacterized protein n=1 Tax=Ensete ventricosum TaxID=4639 RepID=A0A445MBX4_ENSVE|nr:hypothetical protein BHM03_00006754 [Ensete ventricosum]